MSKVRVQRKSQSRKAVIKKLDVQFSQAIALIYKGKCALCGGRGNQTHHYFSRRHYATRWLLNNGVYLCFTCHIRKVHQQADIEPLREHLIKRIGEESFAQLKEVYRSQTNMKINDLLQISEALNKLILEA